MEVLEQQFLCLDVGERPEEAAQTEDSEPVPTASDPWLQGCVPILIDPRYHANQVLKLFYSSLLLSFLKIFSAI